MFAKPKSQEDHQHKFAPKFSNKQQPKIVIDQTTDDIYRSLYCEGGGGTVDTKT